MRSWFYQQEYPKGLVKNVKSNSLGIPEETKEERKESFFDTILPKSLLICNKTYVFCI